MSVRTPKIALGPLEIAILEFLWAHDGAEVKTVYRKVKTSKGPSLNTVQSAMERLFRKGVLTREKISHAYLYRAELSRGQMISRVVGDVLKSFSPDSSDKYLMAFLDYAAEGDESTLDELEKMIKRKRSGRAAKDKSADG